MNAREGTAVTLGGILGGGVVGFLARADMLLVTLVRHDTPAFSLIGSAGIVITFVLMAIGLTTACVWSQRDKLSPSGTRLAARWSLAGVALFSAVVLLTPLRQELAAPGELLLFVPIALLLGAVPVWLTGIFVRALPEPRTTPARVGYRLLAAPAFLASILVPLMLLGGVLQVLGVIPVPDN
jgi:hypothetical protein